jgi:hypothetical protein
LGCPETPPGCMWLSQLPFREVPMLWTFAAQFLASMAPLGTFAWTMPTFWPQSSALAARPRHPSPWVPALAQRAASVPLSRPALVPQRHARPRYPRGRKAHKRPPPLPMAPQFSSPIGHLMLALGGLLTAAPPRPTLPPVAWATAPPAALAPSALFTPGPLMYLTAASLQILSFLQAIRCAAALLPWALRT